MSKAEDLALEKYPKKIEWVGNQWDGAPFDVNSEKRFYYRKGYEEAEKDLELTWEDIEAIDQIFTDVFKDGFDVRTNKYYQEVLRRFKDLKHVK